MTTPPSPRRRTSGSVETAAATTAAPHPEEMRTTIDFKIAPNVSISFSARATPAGLVATALLISAILVPVLLLQKR